MTKSMAGQPASPAELVAPILEKLSPEVAKDAMLAAIDGAIAVAPELAERGAAMRDAAAGVAALLTAFAADTTAVDAQQALASITKPLEPFAAPFMEATLLLDPNFGDDQQRPEGT
jgi:hypothetical protein